MTRRCGGRVCVVDLPHDKASAVTDRLDAAPGGPGYDAQHVVSPHELNFYGSGATITATRRNRHRRFIASPHGAYSCNRTARLRKFSLAAALLQL